MTGDEMDLVRKILAQSVRADDYICQLRDLLVEPIDEVGSLRFLPIDGGRLLPRPHRFIDVKGVLLDSDGVPILLCPFEDADGKLYMLDIQKMGGGNIQTPLDAARLRVEAV